VREPLYYLSSGRPTGQYATPGEAPGLFHLANPRARRPPPDLMVSSALDNLVSPAFVHAVRDLGATGYRVEPVRLLRRDEELPEWGRLIVTGSSPRSWRGFHDEHVREKKYVEDGPWSPDHACFDPAPDGWDGSDVFHPAETAFVVVTQRVRDTLIAARLNVEIVRVGLMPFPLSYALDDAEEAWRRRMGTAPGDLPGEPRCPVLLGEEESPTA